MQTTWQAPDRDSPTVLPELKYDISTALECLLEMDGADGHDEEIVRLITGKEVSRPRRWHKMFERMGLLYREGSDTRLTALGRELRKIKNRNCLKEFAKLASQTLSRYQLKNPVDDTGDVYPEGTDINPYWAIWKAMVDLDGKLHWDELNRELMRVLKREDLDLAISRIKEAREDANYDPVKGGGDNLRLMDRCFTREETTDGRDADGQIRDQITTPWFKRASLGELLLVSPGRDGGGYWTIRPEYADLLEQCVSEGAPAWQPISDKDKWFEYLSDGRLKAVVAPQPLGELVAEFTTKAKDGGLQFEEKLVLRLAAALCAKRFLILTGLSGSGKTKIAQALARWLTPDPGFIIPGNATSGKRQNHHYALVPVGAGWIGNENVFGYPDGLNGNSYISKPALDLVLHALDPANKDTPHFLILDEMNLSHVERYFSDFLSAIESGENLPLHRDKERKSNGRLIPADLKLPDNIFVIGTVNVDETTYMFSPKVLDRANVIEFRLNSHEMRNFLENPSKPEIDKVDGFGEGFSNGFVDAAICSPPAFEDAEKKRFDSELSIFYSILRDHGAEFGYRVANEATLFARHYKILGKGGFWDGTSQDGVIVGWTVKDRSGRDWVDHALDAIVIQKFLPKLHGSKAKLGQLLKKLYAACVASPNILERNVGFLTESDLGDPVKDMPADARYPVSAEKIYRMWKHLNENGFTSFPES